MAVARFGRTDDCFVATFRFAGVVAAADVEAQCRNSGLVVAAVAAAKMP